VTADRVTEKSLRFRRVAAFQSGNKYTTFFYFRARAFLFSFFVFVCARQGNRDAPQRAASESNILHHFTSLESKQWVSADEPTGRKSRKCIRQQSARAISDQSGR
jgi:hypothetical protein